MAWYQLKKLFFCEGSQALTIERYCGNLTEMIGWQITTHYDAISSLFVYLDLNKNSAFIIRIMQIDINTDEEDSYAQGAFEKSYIYVKDFLKKINHEAPTQDCEREFKLFLQRLAKFYLAAVHHRIF